MCKRCDQKREKSKKTCKDKCVLITKKSFGECSNKSYKICKPGYYCLNDNIEFQPKNEKTQAIIIESDNVILDFCGKELKQKNSVGFCIGVLVKSGHQNVTVKGSRGSIRHFSKNGIYVEGGSKNILIENLEITNTAEEGNYTLAEIDPSDGLLKPSLRSAIILGESGYYVSIGMFEEVKGEIQEIVLKDLVLRENKGYSVLNFGNGSDLKIIDNSFSYNHEDRPQSADIQLTSFTLVTYLGVKEDEVDDSFNGLYLNNCSFNYNKLKNIAGIFVSIRLGVNVNNVLMDNINISGNEVENLETQDLTENYGMLLGMVSCLEIKNLKFCDNKVKCLDDGWLSSINLNPVSDILGKYPYEDGFPIEKYLESINIDSLQFSGNTITLNETFFGPVLTAITATHIDGMSITNSKIENNQVLYNNEPGFSTLRLFWLTQFIFGVKNVKIENCKFSNNKANGNDGQNVQIFMRVCQNIDINNCIFTENTGVESIAALIFDLVEFEYPPVYNISLRNSLIENQKEGALFFGGSKCIVENCIFNDISDVCVYLDEIFLDVIPVPSECNVIRNNLFSNSFQGFVDVQNPTTSLVSNNKAFNCNTAFDYTPSHVVSGDLTNFPTEAGPCDNIAINKTLEMNSKKVTIKKDLKNTVKKEKELSQRYKKVKNP